MSHKKTILDKLLSHRLRGFDRFEHSPEAMRKACVSDATYLEVDTRCSADGEVFIYHDRTTGSEVNRQVAFHEETSSVLRQLYFHDGQPLLTLSEALSIFSNRKRLDQTLCIDIKDYGFEGDHLNIVKEHGLEERVCFVSWIPQTILRLDGLGTTAPLILSHWNVFRMSPVNKAVSILFKNMQLKLSHFVIMGRNKCEQLPIKYHRGIQHCLVTDALPKRVLSCLKAHNGGICIPKRLAGERVKQYCSHNEIQLWVYSSGNLKDFTRYASDSFVDVVFCDDTPPILHGISEVAGVQC